jgi:U3 small nucleolar RNA-associated protein 22
MSFFYTASCTYSTRCHCRVQTSQIALSVTPHVVLEAGSQHNALISTLCRVLRRGLGDRSKAIAVIGPPPILGSVSHRPSDTWPTWISIGIILDPEHAYRLVDYGPAAAHEDNTEIEEYREFWGEKAELRRFKDGRILESVVWEAQSTDDRLHIPVSIVQHLLHRHAGIAPSNVTSWQSDLDIMIRLPTTVTDIYQRNGIQGGFRPALLAFQEFVKLVKSMDDDLPLGILNISAASSILRQTSVFAPIPLPSQAAKGLPIHTRYLPAMDIVIQFERVGQWPDDLQAIQKTKLAFLEQIAVALMSKMPSASAELVLEREASPIADHVLLQVTTPGGWAFNARIHHDREATLLDRILDDRSHISKRKPLHASVDPAQGQRRRQAQAALDIHRRRFIHAPAHHRATSRLASRFAAFAGSVRLAKRWLASHWLLGVHVSEEATELLTAMAFIRADQHGGVPNTRERGFVITLAFIRDWTWEEGLVVPIYELDTDDVGVQPDLHSAASTSSSTAWKLVTKMDPDGRVWTAQGPDAVVARRVQALAKATCQVVDGLDRDELVVKVSDCSDFSISQATSLTSACCSLCSIILRMITT